MVLKVITIFLVATIANAQSLPKVACDSLKQERAKYPSSLSSLCANAGQPECPLGSMLNTAAFKAGLGLAGKSSGYWVVSPAGKIASDILMDSTKTGWDVFRDAENTAVVNCGNSIGKITNRPYVAPVDTDPQPPGTCEEKLQQLQYQIDHAKCVLVWP